GKGASPNTVRRKVIRASAPRIGPRTPLPAKDRAMKTLRAQVRRSPYRRIHPFGEQLESIESPTNMLQGPGAFLPACAGPAITAPGTITILGVDEVLGNPDKPPPGWTFSQTEKSTPEETATKPAPAESATPSTTDVAPEMPLDG